MVERKNLYEALRTVITVEKYHPDLSALFKQPYGVTTKPNICNIKVNSIQGRLTANMLEST